MSVRPVCLVLVLIAFAHSLGCSEDYCSPLTTDPPIGVVIAAPTGAVISISGEGICDTPVRCIPRNFEDPQPFAPGCARYQLVPRGLGRCVVTVRVAGGEHRFQTSIIEVSSCGRSYLAAEQRSDPTLVVPASADAAAPETLP